MRRTMAGGAIASCSMIALSLGVFASAATPERDPCSAAKTQRQLDECLAKEKGKTEVHLRTVYAALLKRLKGADRDRLEHAQGKWVEYMDAHCTAVAALYEGGTLKQAILAGCRGALTQERAANLGKDYADILNP